MNLADHDGAYGAHLESAGPAVALFAARIDRSLGARTVLDLGDDDDIRDALRARGLAAERVGVDDDGKIVGLPNGPWDVVLCLGVLDRVAPAEAHHLIERVTALTDRILVSDRRLQRTPCDQLSVPSHAKWAGALAERSFFRRTEVDADIAGPWAVVFQRENITHHDLASRYEMLLHDIAEGAQSSATRADYIQAREMTELRHQLITSRDFAIGAEAEISRLRTECEQLRNALDEVYHSTSWLVVRRGIAPLGKHLKRAVGRDR